MFYIRLSDVSHLIAESLYPLTDRSAFPAPAAGNLILCFYESDLFCWIPHVSDTM